MKSNTGDYRHSTLRPSLTPLFVCGLSLWIGCAITYGAFPPLNPSLSKGIGIACALAGCTLNVISFFRIKNLFVFSCGFLLLGSALGFAAAYSLQRTAEEATDAVQNEVTVILLEDSSNTGFGENARVEIRNDNGSSFSAKGQFGKSGRLYYGETFKARGTFKPIDLKKDNHLWQQGSAGTIKISHFEKIQNNPVIDMLTRFRIKTINSFSSFTSNLESSSVLQAMICGYRYDLSGSQIYSSYQTCGLAHLVAVSGAHLVIVTSLIAAILKRIRCPRKVSITFLLIIMISYLIFSAAPLSAIRATVMSSVGILSLLGKRRPSSINGIGVALILVILATPQASVSVSFTLSVLATIGIILFSPLIQSWFMSTRIERFPFLVDAISLTLASSFLAQLYSCSIFSIMPLISPLANLLCAPLFSVICSLGIISALFNTFDIPLAAFAMQGAAFLAHLMNRAIDICAAIPFSSIPFTCPTVVALVTTALISLLLWTLWPSFKQLLPIIPLLFTCVAVCWVNIQTSDTITMFNVGQGDSFLVRSRGKSLLIDTGNNDRQLLASLANNYVFSLDAVLITHADDDHCGSLEALKNKVRVDTIFLAKDTWNCNNQNSQNLLNHSYDLASNVKALNIGDRISFGCFTAKVLWPKEFHNDGGNGDSLCVLLEYDGNDDGVIDSKTLMCGDAEKDELSEILKNEEFGPVDILKIGHHGSKNAFTSKEIQLLSPRIALIGVGEGNRYGHPSSEALEELNEVQANIFRSDQDGEVTCTLKPDSISVQITG